MLRINIAKRAQKFLRQLPPKHGRQIAAKFFQLQNEPYPNDAKELTGHPLWWRATAGEYRIIYRVTDDTLFVEIVGKRNDDEVYRQLRRLID